MRNKIVIDGKEVKNITITDKHNEVVAVISGNGDIVENKEYKVMFNVGEHLS